MGLFTLNSTSLLLLIFHILLCRSGCYSVITVSFIIFFSCYDLWDLDVAMFIERRCTVLELKCVYTYICQLNNFHVHFFHTYRHFYKHTQTRISPSYLHEVQHFYSLSWIELEVSSALREVNIFLSNCPSGEYICNRKRYRFLSICKKIFFFSSIMFFQPFTFLKPMVPWK